MNLISGSSRKENDVHLKDLRLRKYEQILLCNHITSNRKIIKIFNFEKFNDYIKNFKTKSII